MIGILASLNGNAFGRTDRGTEVTGNALRLVMGNIKGMQPPNPRATFGRSSGTAG